MMQRFDGRALVLLAILGLGVFLSSCGQRKMTVVIPNCPAAGLVAHMATLTRFAGENKTSDNVVFDASMTNLDVSCAEGSDVETTLSFSIQARKGPAFDNPVQEVTYYVVVLRDNFQVTAKKQFTTQIRFQAGKDTAGVRETIVQRFDDFETPKRYHYEILVGFELSPRELHFNVVR